MWSDCKVYGMASSSMSWLEKHVPTHGGKFSYPCIVSGCKMRFSSQVSLRCIFDMILPTIAIIPPRVLANANIHIFRKCSSVMSINILQPKKTKMGPKRTQIIVPAAPLQQTGYQVQRHQRNHPANILIQSVLTE